MSEDTRKNVAGPGDGPEAEATPDREAALPKDHEVYTPQGGGSGAGSGPIGEVPAVADTSAAPDPKGIALPLVGPEAATAQALGLGAEASQEGEAGVPSKPEASSIRLLLTLGVAGAIAGALLVFVFLWADPLIQAENARVLREAVTEVLKGPDHFESVFVLDGELTTRIPEGVDTLDLDKVFLGYDAAGNPLGFAMAADGFGFQDIIRLIFGYDAQARQVLGMKVLGHAETPGLGDKIVRDSAFVGEFDGVDTPIVGVKPSRSTGASDQVDMITGVTISSNAVIRIINERIAELGDLLAAYQPPEGGPPPDTVVGGGGDR